MLFLNYLQLHTNSADFTLKIPPEIEKTILENWKRTCMFDSVMKSS